MKRTFLLGWLLAGMVVVAGGVAGIETDTPINETTTATTVTEPADTTMPDTTSQEKTTQTISQQSETTDRGSRNSNVTIPINSTALPRNCSVSVATKGNVTIAIAKSGNETVATANVSAAWLVYTNRVERVNERVNERLPEWVSNMSAIRMTSIGQSNTTMVQGESVSRVVIGVAPKQVGEIREEIPQQINCVEIAVKPVGRIVPAGGEGAASKVNTIENSSETLTVSDEFTLTEVGNTTSETTSSSSTGAGFGVGAAVVAVYVLVLVRRR